MTHKYRRAMIVLQALSFVGGAAIADVEHDRDPTTGLETWQSQGKGVSFSFTQLLPDQSRAYFQGRGFQPANAELVAVACVFQTVIRNRADAVAPVDLDLSGWRVIRMQGNTRPPRLEADWQREWERCQVAGPARTAFRWSLFPTRQSFQPGDWNMGMVTFNLPPGERFDLELTWRQDGKPRRLVFNALRCAPDQP